MFKQRFPYFYYKERQIIITFLNLKDVSLSYVLGRSAL